MFGSLLKKRCTPCKGGTPPLSEAQAKNFLEQVPDWLLLGSKISKTFTFKNFKEAIAFVNHVAKLAEQEGHHPDIEVFGWNKVKITLWTHAIGGLSENDFIVAAKVDGLEKS